MENIIYSDEKIKIYLIEYDFYLDVFEKIDTKSVYQVLMSNPNIIVTNFNAIKESISNPPKEKVLFGKKALPIEVEVSSDAMKAWIKLNMNQLEFEKYDKKKLMEEIIEKLNEKKIVYGIDYDEIANLTSNSKALIAKGMEPQNGRDSKFEMPDLTAKKVVEVKETQEVDFYNLNSIYNLRVGDWAGERINATDGVPGKNIYGDIVNPIRGKNKPIHFDKKTIKSEESSEKIVLSAKIEGALNFKSDQKTLAVFPCVKVSDVDLQTGNIETESFLIVEGTILDGFKVYAKNGVDVKGKAGIGNCTIKSEGDINIFSGINGNGNGHCNIYSGGNVYTKFANFANIESKGIVEISEYTYYSNIKASEVYIGKVAAGKTIGGVITADYMVVMQEMGTKMEKKTEVNVLGFNRLELDKRKNENLQKIEEIKVQMSKNLQKLKIFTSNNSTEIGVKETIKKLNEDIKKAIEEINFYEKLNVKINTMFSIKGEGMVKVQSKVYPKSQIKIKDKVVQISDEKRGITYYYNKDDKNISQA